MTIKVDLLPTEKKSFGIDPAMIVMFLLIIGAAALMLLYSQRLNTAIEAEEARIETINQEIKQIETKLPRVEEMKNRIQSLKREIKMIKSLVHDPLRYANLLQEVAILLPENVFLNSLSIDPRGRQVTISGSAAEVAGRLPLATIAQLMRNFNDSAYFRSSTLSSTSETSIPPGDTRAFTFTLNIAYDEEKAATEPPTGMGQGSVPTEDPEALRAEQGEADEELDSELDSAATPDATATPAATETPATEG
ncbi:MAG: PilN domain-containing protein [Vulcanimicrobiota bacterium]